MINKKRDDEIVNSQYFVFDLGGTLLKVDTPHFRQFDEIEKKKVGLKKEDYDIIFAEITETLYHENQKNTYEQIPTYKIVNDILCKYNVCLTVEDVIGLMWKMLGEESCEYLPPIQGVPELLNHLYEQDIQIYGMSNTVLPEKLLDKILEKHDIKKYFKGILLSSECGYRKPCDNFFEILEKYMNCKEKDTIVVIGDNYEKDIYPAIKRGYDTIYVGIEKINSNYQPQYVAENIEKLSKIMFNRYLSKKGEGDYVS